LTEKEALVEIACRLYDAGTLHMWPAAQLAGLTRDEFCSELLKRNLPVFRITEEDFQQDMLALDRLFGVGDPK